MAPKITALSELEQGRMLAASGNLEGAALHYAEALSLEPDFFEAARLLTLTWADLGEIDQAEYFARQALELDPASAEMHLHLGNMLRSQGRLEEALEACTDAVRAQPGLSAAHNNLGNAYRDLGRKQEAAAAFLRAIELDPRSAEAHLNQALVLHESGALAAAIEHYRASIETRPDFLQAQLNLGYAYEQAGEPRLAIQCYEAVLRLDPSLAQGHVNLALQKLLLGEFQPGWDHYEWRWRLPEWRARMPLADRPRWSGSALDGKAILLYWEQGFGDAIQFVRYAPLVAARGGKVLLLCQPELKALFAAVPGVSAVFDDADTLPEFACCCPLMSLPRIFLTDLGSIPARSPYLQAPPHSTARWRSRLESSSRTTKVGLVWSSSSTNATSALRTLSPQDLAPLQGVRGVTYYGLHPAGANVSTPAGLSLIDVGEDLVDFSATAGLVENLDLVISIDSAVCHLAGALGKPVWTLVRHPGEWRWLLEREDSPWYPTMRLFRQRQGERWLGVMERVVEALDQAAHGG